MSAALQQLHTAAAANGYQVAAHIRDKKLMFSLVDDGRGQVKKTLEFDSAESALDFLGKRSALYADFLDGLPNHAVASAPGIDDFLNEKPVLDTVGYNPHLPLMLTMGQHLDSILTHRVLKGVTRFTVFSDSYWRDLKPGERDTFDIQFHADTERMVPEHAIEVHIAAGVSRDVAIAALKAICSEIESLQSLESFTPRQSKPAADNDSDSIPF